MKIIIFEINCFFFYFPENYSRRVCKSTDKKILALAIVSRWIAAHAYLGLVDKTCIWGFQQSEIQTCVLSNKD